MRIRNRLPSSCIPFRRRLTAPQGKDARMNSRSMARRAGEKDRGLEQEAILAEFLIGAEVSWLLAEPMTEENLQRIRELEGSVGPTSRARHLRLI